MKYKLLGIDVDGTLIGPDQQVTREIIRAVGAAKRAGLRICLATGRSYVETEPIWRQLRLSTQHAPVILSGGALVCEPLTGRTLWARTIPRQLAFEFADALDELGHSAMAIVDVWRWGVDYYLAESADADVAARQWFAKMDVKVRSVRRLADAVELPNPLRISFVVDPDRAAATVAKLLEQFGSRLNIHSIVAPNYGVTVIEAFADGTDKFAALTYVAQGYQISSAHIAAIGDDVNDLAMIRKAGLGVAMGRAVESVRNAADYVATDGLAAFIDGLVAGQFEGV